jgi:hypothetical protein
MNSSTLCAEIMAEARYHNPKASLIQILDGVTELLSNEVLPEVLKNLSLPKFPSWSSILIAESRKERRGKKFKDSKSLRDRRVAIQQVEYVKRQMGWDGSDTSTSVRHFSDSTSPIFFPRFDLASVEEVSNHGSGYGKETKTPIEEEVGKPYPNILFPLKPQDTISLSKEIQQKIVSEPIVERAFKNIELSIRKLVDAKKLETSIDMSFRSDPEIPSWKKYVITITLPLNIDFNARMNMWTLFDLVIRKEITELAKNASDDERKFFDDLNKSLFLHVEL